MKIFAPVLAVVVMLGVLTGCHTNACRQPMEPMHHHMSYKGEG